VDALVDALAREIRPRSLATHAATRAIEDGFGAMRRGMRTVERRRAPLGARVRLQLSVERG
jgi:hypothetical protein